MIAALVFGGLAVWLMLRASLASGAGRFARRRRSALSRFRPGLHRLPGGRILPAPPLPHGDAARLVLSGPLCRYHRRGRRATDLEDEAESSCYSAAGSRTVKVEPDPSVLATSTWPPWRSATWRTMLRPEAGPAGLARPRLVDPVEASRRCGVARPPGCPRRRPGPRARPIAARSLPVSVRTLTAMWPPGSV